MTVRIFFFAVAGVILFFLFIPDLFPKCACCHRKKLRPFFSIHKAVSVSPGYSGSRSVCRKCCGAYDIENLGDLDRLLAIRKKLKLKSLL